MPPPPSSVWIGGYEWTINPRAEKAQELDGCFGMTYFDEVEDGASMYSIYYNAERPAREVFDTVWHELTHALNHAHGLKLTARSHNKNEEAVARVHGYGWTQALMDNPKLREWLCLACDYIKSQQENVTA